MASWNHDPNDTTERVVAVAAAAYVINSIVWDQERTRAGLAPSLIKDKSRRTRFSGESSRTGSEYAESKVPETDATDEKATRPASSFKPSVSFADHIGSPSETPDFLSGQPQSATPKPYLHPIEHESAEPKPYLRPTKSERETPKPVSKAQKPDQSFIRPRTAPTRPEPPPTLKPVDPSIDAKRQSAARPGIEQTKAEAWEKAEMAKIKEKYEKLTSTILDWEEKKKQKARNKLDKEEKSGSEKKKARALNKFRYEMDYIKEVADGARAQAESRKRNDELKVKEKANIIRTTGEVPNTCFCC